jgi:hypothetical protein
MMDAYRLNPEPGAIQRPQQREQHVIGEVRVETEFIDGVIAAHSPAREVQQLGQLPVPPRRLRLASG